MFIVLLELTVTFYDTQYKFNQRITVFYNYVKI